MLMAFTLNKYLPLLFAIFQLPDFVSPPPGTMQCRCGCRVSVCPQVCSMLIIPACAPSHSGSLPKLFITLHAVLNNVSYICLGLYMHSLFRVSGNVKTTWK